MANHLTFIKHTLYNNPKIIVWAHNYHIQEAPEEVGYSKTLGYWLHQDYPDELYTIWSLAYRGNIRYGVVPQIEISRKESRGGFIHGQKETIFC